MQIRKYGLVVVALFIISRLQPLLLGESPRLSLHADQGWKFQFGDPAGAEVPAYLDGSWRTVNLPHDWSIESKPGKDNPSAAGGGFFPTGVGWYRKTFQAPKAWKGHTVIVEFDGIYRDATVYLNGVKLITQPYGYTSFSLDLTQGLKEGASNTLAVRVDNSAQPNSRWYTGSGIYRHVRLVVTQPQHVAHWGVFVTTPDITTQRAAIRVQTTLAGSDLSSRAFSVSTTLYDARGVEVGAASTPFPAGAERPELTQTIAVNSPALWSPSTPSLYRAVTQIRSGKTTVDQVTTTFGIRSLSWAADKGLLLNGKAIKLTGGSVHHDNGALGAAAFDRAEIRKVELLKAAGSNTVRTAHNIPSPAFLDACDRLGLLVLDEPFDSWEAHKLKADYGTDFDANWKADISAMVLRDRNHPAVIMWGIGNEIPEVTVEKGALLAKQLITQLKTLDSTRPLTLAFPGTTTKPTAQAVFSQLDVTGYNYSLEKSYRQDHQLLPERLMLTTESFPTKAFQLWAISTDHPYVLGDLTWTSMDYLGESGIGAWSYGTPEQAKIASHIFDAMMTTATVDTMFTGIVNGVDMDAATKSMSGNPAAKAAMAVLTHEYPWHASDCGDMDLTGFRKPQSYYRDILWNGGDRIYATVRLPAPAGKAIIAAGWATYPSLPSWSWAGEEGKEMQVEVYSGAEKVRLYLNGKLIGEQATDREHEFKAVFPVAYAPGELKAVALRAGRPVAENVLRTAGAAKRLRLTADRTTLNADGQDLAFITVEAIDEEGHLVQSADDNITFALTGPGTIAAVGNGNGEDPSSYEGAERKLFNGRAQVIVRTTTAAGKITVRGQSSGLLAASTSMVAAPSATAELN